MNNTIIRYFFYSLRIQFIVGIPIYLLFTFASGSNLSLKFIILFAAVWSVFYSLFSVLYYYFALKKLGISNFDISHLSSLLVLHKKSSTSFDELFSKIDRFGQFKNFTIKNSKQAILLKSKIFSVVDGDDIIISSNQMNGNIIDYKLEAQQKVKYDLQAYYFNIKNLRTINSYIIT